MFYLNEDQDFWNKFIDEAENHSMTILKYEYNLALNKLASLMIQAPNSDSFD